MGPAGPAGAPGSAATVEVGSVSSLPAGSAATVTNSGTSSDAVLNFGIPAGASGTAITLYGPFASLPSSCTTGTMYTFTSGLFDPAICTATNSWSYFYEGRSITPAARLALTTGGTSSTVTTSDTNGYELLTAAPGGSTSLMTRFFAAPSAPPYSVTFAIKVPALIDTTNYRMLFIGWYDPAIGYQGLNCGTGNGSFGTAAGCRISSFGTTGNALANQVAATLLAAGFAAIRYVKLVNNGTTLAVQLCSDFDNCQPFASVTASTFFTNGMPTRLAWGLQNSVASGATNFTVLGIM
jgi:hypothetical protein